MNLHEVVGALQPVFQSTLVSALGTAFLGIVTALVTYRFQSRERVDGTITWQWSHDYDGDIEEAPFLTIHNRSTSAAYLKSARYLTGNIIRTEVKRYAFDFVEPTDGNFPLEIKAGSAASFPLSKNTADKLMLRANWLNKSIGFVFKRPYLWIEAQTIGGGKLLVAANDATDFQNRPRWIDMRWLPTR